ncbi:MAG: phytanoyl-CoA dioxygenase family protein [Planctomycetes bacterium]|nr:phytanoyl-CoA dioxygenase family protein [Planctomycetota bacterium]
METITSNRISTTGIDPALSDEQIRTYHCEGWVLLPGVFRTAYAADLRAEVMAIMDAIGLPRTSLRQTGEYLAGGRIAALLASPELRSIASRLIGGPAHLYLPFTAVKSPGGGKFSFHQDNQYTRHDGPSINLWCALEPMRVENGCLRMLSRSHLAGTLASEDDNGHRTVRVEPQEFTSVIMEPGDFVAFSRLTVHGSGPNLTARPRVGYAVQYHREDVKAFWPDEGWFPLIERPRWPTTPVEAIARPTGKIDGH